MGNIAEVRRVVFAHQWQDLAEWVRALENLADLTDEEIDGVADTTRCKQAAVPAVA